MQKNRTDPKIAIPDPIVLKNDVPCKGLKLLKDSQNMLIGLEDGLIKVVCKGTFQIIAESKLIDAPILRIEQVMEAIII